ncbi:type I restriction-modification system subunit M [Mesohalobacter halotolerans]|uniref:site-specific DNA-methyltransferase (adenine-specific) n=1 Tax=Mesohalobacter halotolerans TaxID=1883405 RepID=A0A4U5TRP5_9FLAO|nr:type I restriction-modification system subunit M [Mesohalobacter halotolerans]TKS56491.1 type I restriction-modification system subunit M [Mesohalobacter halotolerans]
MSEDHKKQLETHLWNIANELRGKMDADEFRDYILGFIFFKYLSEKLHLYADEILKHDNISFTDLDADNAKHVELLEAVKEESISKLGYFLYPNELFSQIAKRGNSQSVDSSNFIIEDLTAILNNIEKSTMGTEAEDDFGNLFEDLNLNSTKLGKSVDARNTLIAKVLAHLDKIDFNLQNSESDVLGDAYEYLIAQFASGAGKKAGEFYTPQQVSKVLAKLVTLDKTKIKSVYDPTCGSSSLLLRVSKEANVAYFYGQELNRTTYNLARMNMILHDVHYKRFDIRQENTLEKPQHFDQTFEAIVANPPFSAKWSANDLFLGDERFSHYGKLAPKSKADYAFVQHMLYHLDDQGTMAVVLPHGALFRGGAEGHIREFIIKEKNYLDAVIGLPANIFYGTSIPTCILVYKKCRVHDKDILFIDASEHYEKIKTQNYLTEEHVLKIIDTYRERQDVDKYAYVASLDEVAENDYNLNIPRYVDTFEEEEPVNLDQVSEDLKNLETDIAETDKAISGYCQELNIKTPF